MKPWIIEFENNVWPEESLTAAEAVDVQRLTGGGWESVHPLRGPLSTVAIVATLLCTRTGEPLHLALERVQALPATDLLDCVKAGDVAPVTGPPAAADEPAESFS